MSTVSVIVIGDEILSGKFVDENTPFLIRRLRALGHALARAVVIPDDLEEIAREVGFSQRFDVIITTGGVGPTHDDRTMEGVALGLGVPLVEAPALVALMEARLGALNEAARRMARVPQGSELVADPDLWFPLVIAGKVHVLPGVPSLMARKFEAAAARWSPRPLFTARLVTAERELAIAARLEAADRRWSGVSIGSYPRYDDGPRHVIVTLEGPSAEAVEACRAWLADQLLPFSP